MRVVFMGTPDFAVPSLQALLQRHEVALVISQPDRRAGRGMELRAGPVAALARSHGLPLAQPARARDPGLEEAVRGTLADLLVVAAYGQLLPPALLDALPGGGVNVHASLLPRWRGASPVTAAILAGDAKTGVSIMRMEAGLDTGPVLLQEETPLGPEETAAGLGQRLAVLGAGALLRGLDAIAAGTARFVPQDDARATYAPLVRKSDGDLEWSRPVLTLERSIRAYDPWPGVRLPLAGEPMRLLRGRPRPGWFVTAAPPAPGSVLEVGPDGILVMAGDAPFLVEEVQPPGRRPMRAADYARGRRGLLPTGMA